jgi:hypothetical protein
MLLLDTSRYPAGDRAEVLQSGLVELAGVELAPVDGDDLMKVRFRAWDLGDGCSLLNAQSSGFEFRRRPPRDSGDESPLIGFSMMPTGRALFSQHDRHEIVPGGGLFIAEMSRSFDCRFAGGSEGINFQVPLEVLDVPLAEVQRAAQCLMRSPLAALAGHHLQALAAYTRKFDAPQPAAQLAALHVLRALIKSFGAD